MTQQTTNLIISQTNRCIPDFNLKKINQKCVNFINQHTTIECVVAPDEDGTFWDGIRTVGNVMTVELGMAHTGDLLHEAGHLATMLITSRSEISHDMDFMPELKELINKTKMPYGCDNAATGWAFAACLFLDLDTVLPFETGYEQGDMLHLICHSSTSNQFGTALRELGLHPDTDIWNMQHWDINLI